MAGFGYLSELFPEEGEITQLKYDLQFEKREIRRHIELYNSFNPETERPHEINFRKHIIAVTAINIVELEDKIYQLEKQNEKV